MAALLASPPPEIAEESLHDVVGSLRLDEHPSVVAGNGNRIGKELVPVLVDLINHRLPTAVGGVIGAGSYLLAKLLDSLLDGAQGDWITAGIEARRSALFGDPHGLTELVKHLDFDIDGLEHSPQASSAGNFLQGAREFEQRNGRLELHFLPPYAPDLNPDEFVWSYMKTNGLKKKPGGGI